MKIGWVRFALSRGLPSVLSSVTLVKEPDSIYYYVSFVVEVPENVKALPVRQVTSRDTEIDHDLIAIIYANPVTGKVAQEKTPNPAASGTAPEACTARVVTETEELSEPHQGTGQGCARTAKPAWIITTTSRHL